MKWSEDVERRREYMREYMANSKWVKVATNVEESKKEELQDYLKKHGFKSMDEFVRTCIDTYVREHP